MIVIIKRIIKKLYFIFLYINKKVKIIKKANVDFSTKFEGNNIIHNNTMISNSKIGFATYIGENSSLVNTYVGKYCSIASNVKTIVSTHPTSVFVSTHPAFFSIRKQSGFSYVKENKFNEIQYIDSEKKISVQIGNDVWIGSNVTILGGIEIGDGAIIGANTIVTKNIEPYSINVGIPSKKIKYRFEQEDIQFLKDFKWWDKSEEWIKNNADAFDDIKKIKGLI